MTAWDGWLALSYQAILEGKPKIKEETGTEKDKKRKVAEESEEPEKQKKQQKRNSKTRNLQKTSKTMIRTKSS